MKGVDIDVFKIHIWKQVCDWTVSKILGFFPDFTSCCEIYTFH